MNNRLHTFFFVAFLLITAHSKLKATDIDAQNNQLTAGFDIYVGSLFSYETQAQKIAFIQHLAEEGVQQNVIDALYELIGVDLKAQTAQPKKQDKQPVTAQEEKYPKVTELLKAQEGAEKGDLEDIIPLIRGTFSPEEFEEFLRRLREEPKLYGIMNRQNLTVAYYDSKKEAPNKPTPSATANAGAAAPRKTEKTMPTSSNSGFGGFGNLLSRGLEFGRSFIQPQVATKPTPEVQQPTPMPAVQQPIAAAQQVEAQPVIAPQIEQPQPPIREERITNILRHQEGAAEGYVEDNLIQQFINYDKQGNNFLTPAEFEELFRRLKANPTLYKIQNPKKLTLEHYGIGNRAPNAQNKAVALPGPDPLALLNKKPKKSILRPEGAPKKNKRRLSFNKILTQEEYAQSDEQNEDVSKWEKTNENDRHPQDDDVTVEAQKNKQINSRANTENELLFAQEKNKDLTLKEIETTLKRAQLYFEANPKEDTISPYRLLEMIKQGSNRQNISSMSKRLSPQNKILLFEEFKKGYSNESYRNAKVTLDTLKGTLFKTKAIPNELFIKFPSQELIDWLMTPPDQRSPIDKNDIPANALQANHVIPEQHPVQAVTPTAQAAAQSIVDKTATSATQPTAAVVQPGESTNQKSQAKPLLTPVILTPVTAIAAAGAAATTNKPDIRALTEEEQKLIERFIRIPDMGILENASLPVLRALRSNDQVINFYKDKIYTALAFKESDLKKEAINTTSMEVFNQIIFDLPQENISILSKQLNARKGFLPLVDEKLKVLNLHAEKPFSSNNFKERNNKKKVTFSPTIRALPSIDILETDPQRFKFDTIQSQETTQDLDDDEDPYSFLRIASSIDSNRRKTYKNTILENYTPNKQEVGLFTGGTQEDVSAEENNELENNKNVASPYFQTLLNTTERDAAKKGKEVKEQRKTEKAKEFLTRLLFDEITPGDQLNTMIRRAYNLFLDEKDQKEFRDTYRDHPKMSIIDSALTNRSI